MTDTEIINLYWQRSPCAIEETDSKFGKYCFSVAYGILSDRGDAEESVNDTWWDTWNSIPPKQPQSLKAYLGKLCRHISISRLRRKMAAKRGGGEAALAIEELAECVPASCDLQAMLESKELTFLLNTFLHSLPERERNLFVARYWYSLPISDIALKFGMKENTVKTSLYRSRKKLLEHLEKGGY